jgi:hypothetical protein
MLHKKKMPVI